MMLVAGGMPTVPEVVGSEERRVGEEEWAGGGVEELEMRKLATRPLNVWFWVAVSVGWIRFTVRTSASATLMGLLAVAVARVGSSSLRVTVTVKFPSSA